MKSPVPGCSIFTTSAPISPSRPAQKGAAMRVPRSRTRSPSSGPLMRRSRAALFALHRVHPALLARGGPVERGRGVAHELVDHEVESPRLALTLRVEHV